MPRPRKPYHPAQLGEPTRERSRKGGGFHLENLAPAGAPPVYRALEKSPLTPLEARVRVAAEEAMEAVPGKKPQQTFLDRALNDAEVHPLFRFIVGTMIAEGRMRLSASDSRQPIFIKSDGQGRLPFSQAERLEIGARQFVYAKLPEESQRDIDILTDQVMPRDPHDRKFYISPVEFGKIVSRSSDERVAKGAYIGTFKKLAHHVNALYVEWELAQFRRKLELKASGKLDNTDIQKLSTGKLQKAIA